MLRHIKLCANFLGPSCIRCGQKSNVFSFSKVMITNVYCHVFMTYSVCSLHKSLCSTVTVSFSAAQFWYAGGADLWVLLHAKFRGGSVYVLIYNHIYIHANLTNFGNFGGSYTYSPFTDQGQSWYTTLPNVKRPKSPDNFVKFARRMRVFGVFIFTNFEKCGKLQFLGPTPPPLHRWSEIWRGASTPDFTPPLSVQRVAPVGRDAGGNWRKRGGLG